MTAAQPVPLFILSFRQRDELASLAAGAGWQVVAARRAGGAERRFLSSGAALAVIDARGAPGEGLAAAAMLSGAVEANGGAMLALVSRGEIGAIAALYDAGATHFLASPFSDAEFLQALRFAMRHAERMAREWQAGPVFAPLGWRYDLARRAVVLTPGLAAMLGSDDEPGVRALLRQARAGGPGGRAGGVAARVGAAPGDGVRRTISMALAAWCSMCSSMSRNAASMRSSSRWAARPSRPPKCARRWPVRATPPARDAG